MLLNLFESYPDCMHLFTAYKTALIFSCFFLFKIVIIYSSREFRRKKNLTGSRVARVTRSGLMGIEKVVYL